MEDRKQVIDCFEEQLKNALNNTSDSCCISINHHREIWDEILKAIQDTKQALTTRSKKEQAFEIIKNKYVFIELLIISPSVEKYNRNQEPFKILTQEEFDLLKEVLKDDED